MPASPLTILPRLLTVPSRLRDRYLPRDWPALRVLAVAYVLVQLAGIGWDLPCSTEWENDAVAPRDFLAGVALNLPPGPGHTYPLLHNFLIALLSLPVLLVAAATATELGSFEAVRDHVLGYGFMTPIAVLARLLAILLSTLALAALARLVARLWNRRAALWAATFATTCVAVGYYGRTGNLDGPYLAWSALAAERLLDLAERGKPADYRDFFLLAAASVATKDQAYALWLLPIPLLLVALPALRPELLAAGSDHWRRLLRGLGWGAVGYGLLSGAIVNPPGGLHRMQTLLGPASQDWREYERSVAGLLQNLRDLLALLDDAWWPTPVLLLVPLGLVATAWRPVPGSSPLDPRRAVLRWLPLLLAVSFLCAFTLMVARTGHRFVLPVGFFLAVYLGVQADALLDLPRPARRVAAVGLVGLAAASALQGVEVLMTQWSDARRPLEAWLAALPAGTRVETAGPTVAQPRWGLQTSHLEVTRVGPTPPGSRNPIPGMREEQAGYPQYSQRHADVLVVPGPFLDGFLPAQRAAGASEQAVVARTKNGPVVEHFADLAAGRLPDRTTAVVRTRLPPWAESLGLRVRQVHSSTGQRWLVAARPELGLPPGAEPVH